MKRLIYLLPLLSGCLANSPFDDSVRETNPALFWSIGEVAGCGFVVLFVVVLTTVLMVRD